MKSIIAFLLITTFSIAQSVDDLKRDSKSMYDASYNMDFEKVLDFTYPKIFEVVSKEVLLKSMDEAFQNDVLRIRLVFPDPKFSFSEIKKIENKTFCVITYNSAMRIIFEEPLSTEQITQMTNTFTENMKNKKVTFEKSRNGFYLEGEEIMIAVTDELTNNVWKFINYDRSQSRIFEMIFNESIKKELGLN
ncbi:hypothetical protein [Flavobacterium orientale]|uniref:Uncharacterized protein n=1 Tax=Flavobacterium orientale TaxID=1756020 RepID=A0A916Y0P8_9FLAO|nr:hypothetical protein [Flavobacterium orientale]GGD25530.1 hypothetical protein GCM10011343_14600 [Flavobacterium orientale]